MKVDYTGIVFWIATAVILVAAVYDIKYRRIPNWLTFSAMAAGISCHLYSAGAQGALFSAFGLLLGLCVFMGFYMLGGMGAGDVKLMAALGTLLGPQDILFAALYTGLAGGVYVMLLLIVRKNNRKVLPRYYWMAKSLLWTGHCAHIQEVEGEKTTPLRYGIPIAVGTLIVLVQRII